jgi:hypothetical protein
MTESAPAPPDPELLGVPLSVYAAVLAYTAEGVPLAESLEHAAIAAEDWPIVREAWCERLAESALEGGALIAACDQHRFRAEAHVERPLPPLDVDLRAFVAFFHAFTRAEDPLEFLAKQRLVEVDLFRLLALWQARTSADAALREEHARLLGEPAEPPPEVEPRLPILRPETRWPARGERIPAVARAAAPANPSLAETSLALDLSKIVLPFARSSDMSPAGFSTGAPAVSARSRLGDTSLAVGPKDAPALPFAAAQPPETKALPSLPSLPVVPVVPVSPPAPSFPAPAPAWPAPAARPADPPSPPFAAAPPSHLAATSPVLSPVSAAPLPFAPSSTPSPLAMPSSAAGAPPVSRPDPRLGGTSPAPLEAPRPALPFGNAAPSSAAPEPRLSLVAYATMHAEIAANPSAAMATIARYGLSPATKPLEDAAWKARFAREPALRMEWMRELVEAGNRLRGK